MISKILRLFAVAANHIHPLHRARKGRQNTLRQTEFRFEPSALFSSEVATVFGYFEMELPQR